MKRKMILLWLSLCMLALRFMAPVLAQTGNVDIAKTEQGDKVVYEVNLTPNATINAADIAISYDPAQLTDIHIQDGALISGDNALIATNHDATEHVVYISYASLNDNPGGGSICVLTFNKLSPSSKEEKKTETKTETDKPVIGVDVGGVYNKAGESISPIVTGDNTVVMVAKGKKITDADNGAQAVGLSTEAMDLSKRGVSKTKPDMPDNSSNVNASTGFGTGTIVGIIAAVLVVIGLGIFLIFKKKKSS